MSGVFYLIFYLCSYLGEGGRPPGGLEVLVMGSDVRDLVLGRRNIVMENISNRWKFVSSLESLSSHANWEREEINASFRMVFRGGGGTPFIDFTYNDLNFEALYLK